MISNANLERFLKYRNFGTLSTPSTPLSTTSFKKHLTYNSTTAVCM